MEPLIEILERQQAARGGDDVVLQKLMGEVVRLAEEHCVLRDRLESCQALAAAGEACDDDAIDAFEPTDDMVEARIARHKAFFEDLFERLGD